MIATNNKRNSMPKIMNLARCMINTKVSKLLLFILLLIGLGHFVIQYIISTPPENSLNSRANPVGQDDSRLRNIKQIEELMRIKRSVSSELRELESKRNALQEEVIGFQSQSTDAEKESKRAKSDLDSLRRQILQTKNEKMELMNQNPKMAPPVRLLPNEKDNVEVPAPVHFERCAMHDSFDYSRCSLTSQFPVFVYPVSNSNVKPIWTISPYIADVTINAFLGNPYITTDPKIACLYVVLIGEVEDLQEEHQDGSVLSRWLSALPHWRGDGRNHLVVHLSRQTTNQNLMAGVNTGRAMVAQSSFLRYQLREGFDIVIPSVMTSSDKVHMLKTYNRNLEDQPPDSDDIDVIMQVPVMRKYFLTFSGQWGSQIDPLLKADEVGGIISPDTNLNDKHVDKDFHQALVENLQKMSEDESHGKMFFEMECKEGRKLIPGLKSEWSMCGDTENRLLLLSQSTFTLIMTPEDNQLVSTPLITTRIAEALHTGAVPVVLGSQIILPFHEHVDWTKAAIIWPKARITELSFLLGSFPHSDVSSMRRQGQFIYDTYFASAKAVLDAALSTIRTRINIPPVSTQDEVGTVFEHRSYPFHKEDAPGDAQLEFAMPPPEGKIDSVRFVRNFTCVTLDAKDSWNKMPGPFHLFPSSPFDRILSSDAKFIGSSTGFRPIGEGVGGAGEVFQQSLGGNVPREQFTIVMLTYQREGIMLQSLQRLKGLPYLNKVIVVWNSPETPADELQWPDIEVEVVVIRPKHNSLNNRFLPYSEIDTDAVLSLDDDAHLRHDEILFGFRVWRECRERIVGFPGRYHAWDLSKSEWKYLSEYCCELSMVLTGAAFFHKYYMYMYSYWMPQEIRDKVDEYMNCEDIAMNFLVSHLTRMPPVKVTSRWTFRCPGCPEALSQDESHFNERHICINYFVKVFGYMPLLNTQFRVDSILFKTRLPHDKQKCFKFI